MNTLKRITTRNIFQKNFSQKVKFNYEDALNLNSLLKEEESMVLIN